ncbi:hypothetical protein FHS43_005029 [Streptosporangium becharense]|uniref:Uncharacterized protein n=1 Tax=Streptosporangium becharense TaxID=1816182 RepID=A0A7W9ICB7_9ACTN|nr:hypothetical protein [Streptosporangium becharense]MBB2913720.1 hypothetical protein [Streptosporangium becharense]MBB5817801.1 hypothetical protein [Streptosporangium becharense]
MTVIDPGMHTGRHETPWQIDFRARERQERLLIGRLSAGLALGLVLGLTGESLSDVLPAHVVAAYDPYAYGLLVLVMTRGQRQAGWASLIGVATSAGLAAGHLSAQAVDYDEALFGQAGESWRTALSVTVIAFGLAGHLSRRPGTRGDLAVGLLSGLLFGRVVQHLQHLSGPSPAPSPDGPWILLALLVLGVAFPLLLRPSRPARARTALITLISAALATAFLLLPPMG